MVCLGNEQRSFCIFWDCIQVLHFRLFVDHDGYSIYSKGFLPSVIDVMVIWEKAMAPHSSTLAWKIPWTEEPGGLQSMGSLRVGHDSVTSLSLFTFMHWRRKWQPTPVFLPGESQGRRSLAGCPLWGRAESDTTEATQQQRQKLLTFLSSNSEFLLVQPCSQRF